MGQMVASRIAMVQLFGISVTVDSKDKIPKFNNGSLNFMRRRQQAKELGAGVNENYC